MSYSKSELQLNINALPSLTANFRAAIAAQMTDMNSTGFITDKIENCAQQTSISQGVITPQIQNPNYQH